MCSYGLFKWVFKWHVDFSSLLDFEQQWQVSNLVTQRFPQALPKEDVLCWDNNSYMEFLPLQTCILTNDFLILAL